MKKRHSYIREVEDRRHNYIRKIEAMLEAGEIPLITGLSKLDIYHDDDCAVFSGGFCDCDPDIHYTSPVRMQPCDTTPN